MPSNREAPPVCPNCGADVPRKALACPECGSDHETGWRDFGASSGYDSPEDEFDYDEALKKEFGPEIGPRNVKPVWWITGIVLLVIIAVGLVKSLVR